MRILMISNHLGVQSGVQRYVQNLLLNLDTTKYKVDLFVGLCPADQASTAPALIAHGVNIIGVPDHKKDRIRALAAHLRTHRDYDIIHYHTASKIGAPVCGMMRLLCPRAKIVVHSHIVYPPITLTWRAAHGVYQLFADYFLGCGVAAGRFVFGDHIDRKPNFAVACNAVDQGRFHPDAAARRDGAALRRCDKVELVRLGVKTEAAVPARIAGYRLQKAGNIHRIGRNKAVPAALRIAPEKIQRS